MTTPFLAGQRLRAADLNTLLAPGYTSYPVILTGQTVNPAINNGTLEGYYRWIPGGDEVEVYIRMVWGSTSTGGTGYWIWSMPFNADATLYTFFVGSAWMEDVSAQSRPGTCRILVPTQIAMDLSGGVVTGSVPVTPATGDIYTLSLTYKPA